MTNKEKAKNLLRYALQNAGQEDFLEMLSSLGIGESCLCDMACDVLNELSDVQLEGFVKDWS